MDPQHYVEFQKKPKSQFQEKFQQKDGETLFIYMTLLAVARGPIRE